MANVHLFPTDEALALAAARFVVDSALSTVQKQGRFILALSGGRTPERMFEILAESPLKDEMPWGATHVFWADERCVPLDDPKNNAEQAIATLFSRVKIPKNNLHRIQSNLSPADAARSYEESLVGTFGQMPFRFDLILLGLGADGHTASLFPGTDILGETHRLVRETWVENQKMYRVSMTFPLINMAHTVVFLVSGHEKAAILKAVLEENAEKAYPAQFVQPTPGGLEWFVDAAAATKLN